MVLPPQPSGRRLAALNLGHFDVKVHGADDAGTLWAGTLAGGLFRSNDGGGRWVTVSTHLPPIFAVRMG